jgi:hypothetical protein
MTSFIPSLRASETPPNPNVQTDPQAAALGSAATAPVPWSAALARKTDELIAQDDLNLSRLLGLFRQAYMPVESSHDGHRLLLRMESGLTLAVAADAPRRLIAMAAVFQLHPQADMADKLAAANRINDGMVVLRAAIPDPKTLYLDHHLVCDGGVMAATVIGAVRRMERFVASAIGEHVPPALLA